MKRVAVVGSGIAGLTVARELSPLAHVTLYEAASHPGGHAHTVDVTLDGTTHGVDTGFLVYNEHTYPQLTRLFGTLGVATAASEMSFSVRSGALEWAGSNLNTVFAQRRNAVRPAFWHLLGEIVRFNRIATALADGADDAGLDEPLADFLRRHSLGAGFRDGYLLPMIGCIWSCPTDQMLRFPVGTMLRFCRNHGLLQLTGRPQWRSVVGGSRRYVDAIVAGLADTRLATPVRALRRLPPDSGNAGVMVDTDAGSERHDEVVLACHSDQSLALLDAPSAAEREVLGAVRWHPNRAVLHTDTAQLPRARRAWAAWNYERAADAGRERSGVCLHYWINRLQPLPWRRPVIVSLNPVREPDPAQVVGVYDVAHPVFDAAAIQAQRRLPALQGRSHVWYCGAWTRHGFHEDGLVSALAVTQALRARWQDAPAARDAA